MSGPQGRYPSACTIVARNYLSHARVLARSYLEHHPGARFYVLVVDGLPQGADAGDGVTVIESDELELPHFYEMCFRYDVTELCTAVKPTLLSLLLERYDETVVYLDPDILVMRPMESLQEPLTTASIVLIPHLSEPIPLDGRSPSEQDILIAGAYNLGFIGLSRSGDTKEFLSWWEERLRDLCRVDPASGLMVDQRWIDLVPSLFPSTLVLRDETYNVAYWNLHSRVLGKSESTYTVNGAPLTFFHFSGFNPLRPRALSKHQNRTRVLDGTPLAELLDHYSELLVHEGYEEAKSWGYGFGSFDNGVPVHPILRQLYLGLDDASRLSFDDPFRTDSAGSFLDWATRPTPELANLSPFLATIRRLRYDVASAFPDMAGADRDRFLEWAATQGAAETGYDPSLVRDGSNEVAEALRSPNRELPVGFQGVNLCGYLRDESGVGAAARGYVRALNAAQVPVARKDVSDLSVNRSEDETGTGDSKHSYPVNLVCINADQHFVVMNHQEEFFRGRYNIGIWAWELPTFPEEWHDRFDHYDEVWVGSSFIAAAVSAVSPIPVVRIPPALVPPDRGSRQRGRDSLRAQDDEFIFFFMFDFHSYFERKNPLALIEAFGLAFTPADRARLVIKCVNHRSSHHNYEALLAAADGRRVEFISDYLPATEVADLVAACDAYVSLHRSEGTGLTLAEAMAAGKPVIATAWSGNTDFMDVTNSFPVRFELTEIERTVGPYRAGEVWAEPSVEHAAELMRRVFDHPEEARARGEAGRRHMLERYSPEAVGRLVVERLAVVARRQQTPTRREADIPPRHRGNQDILGPIRKLVDSHIPQDATVIVISKGDEALLRLGTRPAWHFPQTEDGTYAGYYPAESAIAVAHLRSLISKGGRFLLIPETSSWWLDYYSEFRAHLDQHHELLAREGCATLYRLDDGQDGGERSSIQPPTAEVRALMGDIDANTHAAAALQARIDELSSQLEEQRRHAAERAQQLEARIGELTTGADELGHILDETGTRIAAQQRCLDELGRRAEQAADRLDGLEATFRGRPYMAHDVFGALGDLSRPMGYSLDPAAPDGTAGANFEFADLFRGSESFVAERQRCYLRFFEGSSRVVDLGSGRGEFLKLLQEIGVGAVGVEMNASLVTRCRQQGLEVVHADALSYLDGLADGELDGVFSAQFIEHIAPDDLPRLLRLSHQKLRSGGVFVAETVNPESFAALRTFHVDLSHQRPIFPQVLLQLCREAEFASARIFYPLAGGFSQAAYDTAGEYAVVAVRA